MLSNAYFLAKFRFDTAENEPAKNCKNLLIFCDARRNGSRRPSPDARAARPSARHGNPLHAEASGEAVTHRGDAEGASNVPRSCQFLAKFRQNVARFRLYRHRVLQENTRFTAFFKIFQIIQLKILKDGKFFNFCNICKIVAEFSRKLLIFQTDFLLKF